MVRKKNKEPVVRASGAADAQKQTVPLKALLDRNTELTGKASEHVRTSALAGLAVAWLFTGASEGDLSKLASAPTGLLIAAALFAASLSGDILHYYLQARAFKTVARGYEKKGKVSSDQVELRTWVPGVGYFFYNAKVILLFAGYGVLVFVFAKAVFDG
jgi:hypothetical protein